MLRPASAMLAEAGKSYLFVKRMHINDQFLSYLLYRNVLFVKKQVCASILIIGLYYF
jgi:hypothetical protein